VLDLISTRRNGLTNIIPDFVDAAHYFYGDVKAYEEKPIRKKWKPERLSIFETLVHQLADLPVFNAEEIEKAVKAFMSENELGFGDVLPILRVGLTGQMQGPPIFEVMEVMGKEFVTERMKKAFSDFEAIKSK